MRIVSRLTAVIVVGAMPVLAWVLARAAWSMWWGWDDAWRVDDLVALGAAGLGAVVASYLALTGYAMVFGTVVRGGRTLPRMVASLAPESWRRVTATALGVGLVTGVAGPALAAESTTPHVGWTSAHPAAALAVDGWSSDRGDPVAWVVAPSPNAAKPPTTRSPVPVASAEAATAAQASTATTYTVKPGDSLWRIAAGLLGADASDAAIGTTWPHLYAANRDAIGSDPALIHPGTVLTVPSGFTS